jgi:hypothetical protein
MHDWGSIRIGQDPDVMRSGGSAEQDGQDGSGSETVKEPHEGRLHEVKPVNHEMSMSGSCPQSLQCPELFYRLDDAEQQFVVRRIGQCVDGLGVISGILGRRYEIVITEFLEGDREARDMNVWMRSSGEYRCAGPLLVSASTFRHNDQRWQSV